MAAGFAPDTFWRLTPRLYQIHMEGAAIRLRRERELVWWGAMLPHLKKQVTLDQFTGGPADESSRIRQFHMAWDKVDRALRASSGKKRRRSIG